MSEEERERRQEAEHWYAEIQRLDQQVGRYRELGKAVAAYSRVWEYGPVRKYVCPCCGLYTRDEEGPGSYEICLVCWWEDDPLQFRNPDYQGGANRESLNEAREAFRRHGIRGPH